MQLQIPCSFATLYGSLGLRSPLPNVRCPMSAAAGSEFMHMTLVIDIISWLAVRARNENETRIKMLVGSPERERGIPIPPIRQLPVCRLCEMFTLLRTNAQICTGKAGIRGSDQVIITASSSPGHLSNFPLNPTSAVLAWKIVTGPARRQRQVRGAPRRLSSIELLWIAVL